MQRIWLSSLILLLSASSSSSVTFTNGTVVDSGGRVSPSTARSLREAQALKNYLSSILSIPEYSTVSLFELQEPKKLLAVCKCMFPFSKLS